MALRMAEVPVSRSTSTVRPWRESDSAKLIANVVFPTPPFPEETGMIRLMATVTDESTAVQSPTPMQPTFFRKFPLFADLDDRELAAIAAVAKTRRYAKDDVVFHADESGDVFCLIREGQVKITMISPEGKEIILSLLGPGDFFGEMALLDDEPRSATVVATEPLDLVTIWRNDFLQILAENFT